MSSLLTRRGDEDADMQRGKTRRTQGEDGRLHAKERGLRRNQHLDVRPPVSRIGRKQISEV